MKETFIKLKMKVFRFLYSHKAFILKFIFYTMINNEKYSKLFWNATYVEWNCKITEGLLHVDSGILKLDLKQNKTPRKRVRFVFKYFLFVFY